MSEYIDILILFCAFLLGSISITGETIREGDELFLKRINVRGWISISLLLSILLAGSYGVLQTKRKDNVWIANAEKNNEKLIEANQKLKDLSSPLKEDFKVSFMVLFSSEFFKTDVRTAIKKFNSVEYPYFENDKFTKLEDDRFILTISVEIELDGSFGAGSDLYFTYTFDSINGFGDFRIFDNQERQGAVYEPFGKENLWGVGVINGTPENKYRSADLRSIYDLNNAHVSVELSSNLDLLPMKFYGLTIINTPGQSETILFPENGSENGFNSRKYKGKYDCNLRWRNSGDVFLPFSDGVIKIAEDCQ